MKKLIALVFLFLAGLAFGDAESDYVAAVQADSPLYYWRLNDAASPCLPTVGSVNLTITGGTFAQAGQVGNSLYFDGNDDKGQTAASALVLSPYTKVAVEFILWTTAWNDTDDNVFLLGGLEFDAFPCAGNGYWTMYYYKDAVDWASHTFTRPSASAWHHYVATIDYSTNPDICKLYIDGTPTIPAGYRNNTYFSNSSLILMGDWRFQEGYLQHFAVYNILSASDIREHAILAGLATATPTPIFTDVGTETVETTDIFGGLVVRRVEWTADVNGNFQYTFSNIHGQLVAMEAIPLLANPPTALYDISLYDQDDIELLGELGWDRSEATSQILAVNKLTGVPVVFLGDLRLTITAAGASNQGIVNLYVRPTY